MRHQKGDSGRQGFGFARAWWGEDLEDRSWGCDGGILCGVEAAEDGVHQSLGGVQWSAEYSVGKYQQMRCTGRRDRIIVGAPEDAKTRDHNHVCRNKVSPRASQIFLRCKCSL